MSNVVNSAFTTIRAATQMSPKGAAIDLGGGVQGRVYKIEGIVPSPFCSPFRHPIWWWKLRKLRADIRELEKSIHPTIRAKMEAIEDEAFLYGRDR